LQLFRAIVLGVLLHISRKAGPTVILFGYIYALHHFVSQGDGKGLPLTTGLYLITAVIALSVMLMGFRTVIEQASQRADAAILPRLDAWCLRRLLKCDMRPMRIRFSSRYLLDGIVTGCLFLLLTAIAFSASLPLALTLVVVLVAITAFTYYFPHDNGSAGSRTFLQQVMRPANFAEQILIFGLLFVLAVQASADANLVQSTIMVFLIARFGGAFKLFARSFRRLLMTHRRARQRWRHDKLVRRGQAEAVAFDFQQQPAE
jgi:hypothetical protein